MQAQVIGLKAAHRGSGRIAIVVAHKNSCGIFCPLEPGSAGFIAELQVLIGAYGRWGGWLVLLSIAVLISAAYALRAIRCLSTGPERPFGAALAGVAHVADLDRKECAAAWLLAGGIVWIGILPAPLLRLMATSLSRLAIPFGA